MTRSNAREIACHLVYEMNFNGITADEAMNLLMDPDYYPSLASETEIYAERPSGKQAEYLAGVVHGVEREREKLAGFIEKNAIGWSLGRISKVAVAVMEVAMYECEHEADVPTAAAIRRENMRTRTWCPLSTAFLGNLPGRAWRNDGFGAGYQQLHHIGSCI